MFRIITQFVLQPRLFLLCDNQICGNSADRALDRTVDGNQAQRDFLTDATTNGWSIAVMGQLCPQHTAQAREQQAAYLKVEEEKRTGGGIAVVSRGGLVAPNGKPV